MKLSTESGRLAVSLTHVPGRGSGTFEFKTGSHAELDVACSLNFPEKMSTQKNHKISTKKFVFFVLHFLNSSFIHDIHK
jgi:hypothetical protein